MSDSRNDRRTNGNNTPARSMPAVNNYLPFKVLVLAIGLANVAAYS